MIPNLIALAHLAFDEAKWDEGKHPRADDGKFGSGGGASKPSGPTMPQHAAVPPKPAQVSSTLTGVFTQAGFKKQKTPGPNGTVVYYHPTGAKVHVHPAPEGKKWSSKWTHKEAGHEGKETGGEGSGLAKLLGVVVQKAQAKQAAAAPSPVATAAIKAAPDLSLNALSDYTSALNVLEEEGYESAGVSDDGDYAFFNHDDDDGNSEIMAFNKKTLEGYFVDEYAAPTLTPSLTQQTVANVQAGGQALKDLGYKPADINGAEVIYHKDGGAKVKYNAETDAWVAVTPSHMTKEGKGIPALQQLLSGKGIPAGVTNSQQTVQTAAELAAMTSAQKAAATKAKATQAKHSKTHQLYTSLKDAAPQPTAAQQTAIAKYSGSAYSQWNDQLRHNPGYTDANTKALDEYLNASTFPEEVVVHRKVDGEYAKILKSIIFEGTKFIDRGYVSTSASDGAWHGSFQFEITCPKGSRGAAIGKWSHHPSEMEVLLPRGSAFVVTHYDPASKVVKVTLDQGHL